MSQPMQSHILLVYVLRVLWAHALVIVACWLSFVAASSVATRYTSTIHYSTTTSTAHCYHHRHRKQPDEQSVSQIAHELFLSTLPPKKNVHINVVLRVSRAQKYIIPFGFFLIKIN